MALPKGQDQDEDAVKRGGPNLINYNAATGASMALFVGPNLLQRPDRVRQGIREANDGPARTSLVEPKQKRTALGPTDGARYHVLTSTTKFGYLSVHAAMSQSARAQPPSKLRHQLTCPNVHRTIHVIQLARALWN